MTLDAAAASVGTVRQVWFDWERGRRIPSARFMTAIYRFTRGEVVPNHFYELPPIGQMALPFTTPAPLLDHADAAVAHGDDEAPPHEHGVAEADPPLLAAA